MRDFRELKVWKKAYRLTLHHRFPKIRKDFSSDEQL